jgi:DNA-binding response OmpR family regulator
MDKKGRLLIVEDEEAIRNGLVDVFVYHGYAVDIACDGRIGLEKSLSGDYDLILLDVMLPELDGFSVCNQIRSHSRDQAIIMLTAKTTEQDIITGLTLGADDYIAKPFSVRELVLRVEAVLRRVKKDHEVAPELLLGDWQIDTRNLCGKRRESADVIPFTRREIDILAYLHAHRERPVSREELLAEVWEYKRAMNIETRTVDIHMAKLRKKVERDPKEPALIVTVRGEGYRLTL